MDVPTAIEPSPLPQQKQRHGCLTAILVVMIIANSASALMYLLGSGFIRQNSPNMPDWAFPVLIVGSLFNLACAIALFKWKKWGFWGLAASSAVVFFINLSIGLALGSAVLGLMGIFVLYGVLQIGQERKGWTQLE
jgi:hypothetical protein